MGGFNSTPDRTATQSAYRREIDYDDYYRTHFTRRTNVTATQSSFRREIDYDDYYWTDSTRRTNVTATQSSSIKQIDFADDFDDDSDNDFDDFYRTISTPRTNVTATQSSSIKQIDFKGYHRTDSSCPINVTATQSLSIQQIDLNNYYKNDRTRKLISCQICRLDISRKDVFKHTVSKRHKYNKLFIAVSQNRCPNGDVDFIVLDIDRLACRYCNSRLVINSDSDDFIVSHIQDVWHTQKKQASLNQIGFNDTSVSTAGYSNKLLQPLDSFVTHDIKNRKRMKKKVPNLKKKASSLAKLEEKLKEQRVVNNVGQNTDQQYSSISGNYQKMWGIELPKCITIGEGDSYICTICCIEMPPDIMDLGIHINGSEHVRKMISKSLEPKAIDVAKVLGGFRIEETVIDFKATNKIVKNNISQSSTVYQDEIDQFEKELEDCISLGQDSTVKCTVCGTEIPHTSKNINDHLTGKKHQKKILKLIESKKQKLKLEYAKKLVSAPVDVKGTGKISEYNIPQSSAVSQDEIAQFKKEFKDCISLGQNGNAKSTVCGTEIPNTSKNINEHLNGKEHDEKIVKLIESKKQKLESEDVNKLILAPVRIVINGTYKCTICNVWVPNHVKNIKAHEDGIKHVHMKLRRQC